MACSGTVYFSFQVRSMDMYLGFEGYIHVKFNYLIQVTFSVLKAIAPDAFTFKGGHDLQNMVCQIQACISLLYQILTAVGCMTWQYSLCHQVFPCSR